MKDTPSHQRPSTGFSLIELLLVVAVIAVLAVLSFPVINQVTTKSQLVKCIGNFRFLGMALGGYAGDHNGEYPFPNDNRENVELDKRGTWMTRLIKSDSQWTGIGKLFPYIRDKRVYVCPANKAKIKQVNKLGDWASEDGTFPTDYISRGFNQSSHPTRPKFRRLATMGRRSIAACQFAYVPSNPTSFPLSWHKGSYPVLFSDGSVEAIRFPAGAVNQNAPPNINDSTGLQIKVWDYFDGATTTLKL